MALFGPGVIDNGTGLISLVTDSYVDLAPGPSGTGVLANIEFKALALGLSPLSLTNAFLDFSDTGFQVTSGLVTVQSSSSGPVLPEPSTLALLGLGIGALALRTRFVRSAGQ